MNTLRVLLILVGLSAGSCFAQAGHVTVQRFIHFSNGSADSILLIKSLEGLLIQSNKENKANAYVSPEHLPETSALLDELKDMSAGVHSAETNLYPCYLQNVASEDSGLVVQFSFIAVKDNIPTVRASFKLLARKSRDRYLFFSPLKYNTQTWKTKQVAHSSIYYRRNLDLKLPEQYLEKSAEFDRKLGAAPSTTTMYFCNDMQEALELLGVTYKAENNGQSHETFSSFENHQCLLVFGTDSKDSSALDIHDCWHTRLRNSIQAGTGNRFIDEGCAYLYGGSWGYSWNYILKRFKESFPNQSDWLAVYRENKQFGESEKKHLYAAYVINALLVQKIEKDKGFSAVRQFLCSGPKQNDNITYFEALYKADHITPDTFNAEVRRCIKAQGL